jgi:lipopolysaccharide/colanic/teichoic acid biosynthesis glycosyltransferase
MPEPITIVGVGGGLIGLTVHLARRYFDMAKEVVDITLGVILLALLSPVMLLCALLVKVCSRGPVLFTQIRVGKDGREFMMYKFRTMYIDAETRVGATWAQDKDPRVVPVCRWMRRSHMDELPQLLNVIKGDMSLIGPRPERPEILTELEEVYPNIRSRLHVKPGITGLAQIRHGYDTSIEGVRHKLNSDLEYIEKRSWSNEISILLRTLGKLNDKTAR